MPSRQLDSFIFAGCFSPFWLVQMHYVKTNTPNGMCGNQEQSCQEPKEPGHIFGAEEPGRSGAGRSLASMCRLLEPVGYR